MAINLIGKTLFAKPNLQIYHSWNPRVVYISMLIIFKPKDMAMT